MMSRRTFRSVPACKIMRAYQIGIYEKGMPASFSWEEKMLTAKKAGYDFIEISIDETDEKLKRLEWTEDERKELRDLMKKTGIPIRSMCLSGHRKYPLGAPDEKVRARSLEIMEKAIQLADDLGIRIIQLAGYDVYYEKSTPDTVKWFTENLIKSAQMAAKYGISMGFETMETEFMNTVEKAMEYVDIVDSPWLGVYPDIGNLTNAAKTYNTEVSKDLDTGKGHLMAMHLKETIPGHFREIPFGTGHVDFEAGIQKAWDLGVRRFVTEFWDVKDGNWDKEMTNAYTRMTAILDRMK